MHHVFVDFENVPSVDLDVVEGRAVHVTLLIGRNQKKLELALVRQIHRLATQVELVEVGASGPNALDLTLAYYLGQAVQRAPDAQFYIVSRDKDFGPMIGHLQSKNIKVDRFGDFSLLPFVPRLQTVVPARRTTVPPFSPSSKTAGASRRATVPPISPSHPKPAVPSKKPPDDRRAKVKARLKDPKNLNRPTTQKRLFAHIKNALGKEASDAGADDLIRELIEESVLTIDSRGRVVYAAAR